LDRKTTLLSDRTERNKMAFHILDCVDRCIARDGRFFAAEKHVGIHDFHCLGDSLLVASRVANLSRFQTYWLAFYTYLDNYPIGITRTRRNRCLLRSNCI